jgi:hypothetical protein
MLHGIHLTQSNRHPPPHQCWICPRPNIIKAKAFRCPLSPDALPKAPMLSCIATLSCLSSSYASFRAIPSSSRFEPQHPCQPHQSNARVSSLRAVKPGVGAHGRSCNICKWLCCTPPTNTVHCQLIFHQIRGDWRVKSDLNRADGTPLWISKDCLRLALT